jgi:hypothetical protein
MYIRVFLCYRLFAVDRHIDIETELYNGFDMKYHLTYRLLLLQIWCVWSVNFVYPAHHISRG